MQKPLKAPNESHCFMRIRFNHPHQLVKNRTARSKPRFTDLLKVQEAFCLTLAIAETSIPDQQAFVLLSEQYPNTLSCVPLNDGSRRYLEAYIHPSDDNNDIMTNGLVFEKSELRVLPCKGLSDDSKIVTVKLAQIPLNLGRPDVYEGLRTSLAPYGEILDVGIYTEPASKFFMGTGYITLNTKPQIGAPAFQPLHHVLHWMESDKTGGILNTRRIYTASQIYDVVFTFH